MTASASFVSLAIAIVLLTENGAAFTSVGHGVSTSRLSSPNLPTTSPLFMAGFGGGGGSAKGKKAKKAITLPKVRAKAQWDRYADLKKCDKVRVGVRVTGGDSIGEWMEVGKVKSENNGDAEVALVIQRALVAEHAKRIYPVQVPPNAVVEWGYLVESEEDSDDDGEWSVADKSKGDDAPKGIEKKIGFEGKPDAATGFYCYYHGGRVVAREDEGKGKRSTADNPV